MKFSISRIAPNLRSCCLILFKSTMTFISIKPLGSDDPWICIKQAGLQSSLLPGQDIISSILAFSQNTWLFWRVVQLSNYRPLCRREKHQSDFSHVKHCRLRNTSGHSKWASWCEAFKATRGTKCLGTFCCKILTENVWFCHRCSL